MTDYDTPDEPLSEQFEREQPHDIDTERGLLAAMLITASGIDAAESILAGGEDFYRHAHALIYEAILEVHGRPGRESPDPITVAGVLRERGLLTKAGGPQYLHSLISPMTMAGNAEYYAQEVRDLAQRRQLIETLTRALNNAWNSTVDTDEVLDDVTAELQALITGQAEAEAPKLSVAERWEGFIDQLGEGKDPNALDTPWPDLNTVVEMKPGELIVVGAGTGVGKSVLALNQGSHVALHRGLPVLVASMEMGGNELLARITAAEAGVNLERLVRRQPLEMDWDRIAMVTEKLQAAHNFVLDDSPSLTVSKIRARVRWMAAQGRKPAMVIADYLQLITPESGNGQNRTQEVAAISRNLKLLATEFQIPVVALAQFNRGSVGREPLVTDFKDSSQIEQDANLILLMHRPLDEDEPDAPRSGLIHVTVGKNRNGPQGLTVDLEMQGHYGRLVSRSTAVEPAR